MEVSTSAGPPHLKIVHISMSTRSKSLDCTVHTGEFGSRDAGQGSACDLAHVLTGSSTADP